MAESKARFLADTQKADTTAEAFTWPTGRASTNNYVLAMTDKDAGTTEWQATSVAPTITGVSGELNTYFSTTTTGNTQGGADIRKIASICTQKIGNVAGKDLRVGQTITGDNIPSGTTITEITTPSDDNTSNGVITISADADAVASGTTFTFGGEEDGGTLTLTGTDFGTDASLITSIKIMSNTSGANSVTASSFGTPTSTGIPDIVFNGSETGYNTFPADTTWYIEVTKSSLISNKFSSGKSFTKDPTISAITQSVASADYNSGFTGTNGHFGSYGGQVAGGGQDSNTKLLLNFDRGGGTDIEDSSNIGGDGHKITANGNAVIKASPFGDGKSAMYFDGVDGTELLLPNASMPALGNGDFTIEFWARCDDFDVDSGNSIIIDNRDTGNDDGLVIQINRSSGQLKIYDGESGSDAITYSASTQLTEGVWVHVAIVRNSGTLKMYFDGNEVGSASNSSNLTSTYYTIGRARGANEANFKGFLDEIRIAHTAVYTGSFTVPTSRLSKTQSAGTNISAITGTATKLLIHSNLGSYGVHHGIESQRSYTITTNATHYGGNVGQAIDGVITNTYGLDDGQDVNPSGGTPLHFTIDLGEYAVGSARTEVFNKFFWTQSSYGASNDQTHGNWKIQYWNGGSWNDATGGSITNLGDTADAHDFTNTTAYQKYRILGVSGTTDSSPYIHEIGFANGTFTDSSDSGHNITATGVYHSQGYGGIAPAMTFPASKKATGSAGVYFDGVDDYLTIPDSTDFYFPEAFTIDFWINFSVLPTSGNTGIYLDSNDTGTTYTGIVFDSSNGIQTYSNGAWSINEGGVSGWTTGVWRHVAVITNGTTIQIYIDGTQKATGSVNSNPSSDRYNVAIGGFLNSTQKGNFNGNYFNGYIDNFRIILSDESASGKSLYHASANTITVPTQIYGASGPENPSIGSIEITTATEDDVNVTYSLANEDNASVLGSSSDLAIASDSTGANKKKGTLTGTLQGTAGSVTNLRIQAKANDDANRLVEVNETSGVGAVSFTKVSSGKPTLFSARRFIGTGTQRDITGYNFKPDMVWMKYRGGSQSHMLYDSVRGQDSFVYPDLDNQAGSSSAERVTFTSDGFTMASGQTNNTSNNQQIAWAFKAGGAPSGDFPASLPNGIGNGTFNSSSLGYGDVNGFSATDIVQSVNQNSGFSITKFKGVTSTTGGGYIPHNLGGTGGPDLVIIKNLNATQSWAVVHSSLGTNSGHQNWLKLDTNDDAFNGDATTFNGAINQHNNRIYLGNQSSDVGSNVGGGGTSQYYIMYAWKAVAGVSAFGIYTSQSGGTRVYTTHDGTSTGTNGFRPKFIMTKSTNYDSSYAGWTIIDGSRVDFGSNSSGNSIDASSSLPLYANKNYVEGKRAGDSGESSLVSVDLFDDGFKFDGVNNPESNGWDNTPVGKHIYIAFA